MERDVSPGLTRLSYTVVGKHAETGDRPATSRIQQAEMRHGWAPEDTRFHCTTHACCTYGSETTSYLCPQAGNLPCFSIPVTHNPFSGPA